MRGADALELAQQFQPRAVSLDVFLPDMLGWTVLSQLKQNPLDPAYSGSGHHAR
jgi:CheY-like chemotaxis protein